jgi:hypothetical protein
MAHSYPTFFATSQIFHLHIPESLIQSAPGSDYILFFIRIKRFSNSVISPC